MRPRRNPYSFCYLQRSSAGSSKASREPGRYQRLQIRLASDRRIEVIQLSGRFEQQRRSIVAVPRGERDLGTQQTKTRTLQVAEHAGLSRNEQAESVLESTRLELRLRRGDSAFGAPRGFGRERRRALEECRSGGKAAP